MSPGLLPVVPTLPGICGNASLFSETCLKEDIRTFRVVSDLQMVSVALYLSVLYYKSIILPCSTPIQTSNITKDSLWLPWSGIKGAGGRRQRDEAVEGYRDGQLTNSQNCSFHWINLLFLKNPQREWRWEWIWLSVHIYVCVCVCVLQSGPWPTLKPSHHSCLVGLHIACQCMCAY